MRCECRRSLAATPRTAAESCSSSPIWGSLAFRKRGSPADTPIADCRRFQMTTFHSLLAASAGMPLLLPCAHDALSARMIEATGFPAYGIGGAALSATQLGLPDVGLQSFGEYRDAVGRIMEGSGLPVMV